ncbi:hypothetical protein GB937_002725 [Aspergillus fischeri]|nr:hypothetical protein GB937_002725 [Aspergillus fischeri]
MSSATLPFMHEGHTSKGLELVDNRPCVFSCNFPGKIFSPRCFSDPHVILASAIPLAHFASRSRRHYCPSSYGMTLQQASTAVCDAVNTWGRKQLIVLERMPENPES